MIRSIYRNLKFGIQNLIKYFKIIWNDRNWDHTFFLEIMRFKLNLISKEFSKVKHYEGWEEDVVNMKFALEILDRLIAEDYECPEQKEYYDEVLKNMNLTEMSNRTTEERKINLENLKKWAEYSEIEKQNDYLDLFNILKEHLDKWWW